MRRPVLALLALTVLAGCSGLVGSAPEAELTPAPVPEPTATERTGSAIAPGVGGARVFDADRLARAHREAIRNQSYTWHERLRSSELDSNESLAVTSRLLVERERLYRWRLSTSWTYANTSEYTAGDTRYRREVGRAGYRYTTANATGATVRYGDQPVRAISRYLAIGDARVGATQIDGQRYYRVTGTTDRIPVTGGISNYSVEALIAPSGFVRSLAVSYDDVIGDEREHVEYRFQYRKVDQTVVDPPDWARARWPENATIGVQD